MKPTWTSQGPYDPPRWRHMRGADLRIITLAYAAAVLVCISMLLIASVSVTWFEGAENGLAQIIRPLLLIAIYLGSGTLVIALTARKMAFWKGTPHYKLPVPRWYWILAWPMFLGVLIFRIALTRWS